MARGEFIEAARLYEKALPALPAPADDIGQAGISHPASEAGPDDGADLAVEPCQSCRLLIHGASIIGVITVEEKVHSDACELVFS